MLPRWLHNAVHGSGGGQSFDVLSLGNVGAWFDTAEATDAGSGLTFRLTEVLNDLHATTIIDARKPIIGTASNGVPILTCNGSCLQSPLDTATNNPTQWGFSAHMRITSAAGNPVPISIDSAGSGGASTRKLIMQRFTGDLMNVHDAANPTTLARRFGPATLWPLNTWVHIIVELNLGTGGAEATRGIICVDGVPIVCTFSDAVGTPGTLPTAMATPTGFMNLFAQGAVAGGNSWVGQVGRHLLIFNGAMAGVTSGLLTPAARLALSALDRPA